MYASLLALALCATERADAAELELEGPRSCSRGAELQARVERALGRDLHDVPALRCNVHIVRDGGSYAARLELVSAASEPSFQRAFSGKTCGKLMDTLELAVVLAFGSDGAELDAPSLASWAQGVRRGAAWSSARALESERPSEAPPSTAVPTKPAGESGASTPVGAPRGTLLPQFDLRPIAGPPSDSPSSGIVPISARGQPEATPREARPALPHARALRALPQFRSSRALLVHATRNTTPPAR